MLSTTVQISLFFGNVVPLILIDLILNIFNVNEMISFFFWMILIQKIMEYIYVLMEIDEK